jgi:hypothetical protein
MSINIIAPLLFVTLISYIGVHQLCNALFQQGVDLPRWSRVALLALVVLLFALVPLGAPAAATWR